MNVQRFIGRTSREAMTRMRQALGDDAVVLSTKPCVEGIEMLAMAPNALAAVERHAEATLTREPAPKAAGRLSAVPQKQTAAPQHAPADEIGEDVKQLSMSTLSFQDYVRERLLKKRRAALRPDEGESRFQESRFSESKFSESKFADSTFADPRHADPAFDARFDARTAEPAHGAHDHRVEPQMAPARVAAQAPAAGLRGAVDHGARIAPAAASQPVARPQPPVAAAPVARAPVAPVHSLADEPAAAPRPAVRREPPVLREPVVADLSARSPQADATMLSELRSMKGLIEERFGALAFMEKLQRAPREAKLTQKLLECGFSPVLIRKLVAGLTPDIADEQAWAANVLERNLPTGERELPIEDQGGVFAMIGATGVGKTTSTAKLAAAFATKHGAANLGLITLDAYRLGAHEQLRAYGRILGVPVHTAHDRPALEDLLDLLSAKKMVLIDTAGLAQRDVRTTELLDMLGHSSVQKLLVVNAAAQGETIDDVLLAYRASNCKGAVLSKLDEAVKLGPALDAAMRHKLKIVAIANGQRVPEDWHRLSAQALVHRALRASGSPAYHFDASEMNLVFAAPQTRARRPGASA